MSSTGRVRRRLRIGGITDRTDRFDHEPDLLLRRKRVYELIDDALFQKYVVFVAGVGFFTDAYAIFAVNAVIPMLSFVYWGGEFEMPAGIRTALLCATLAGSMLGQLIFGILGDWLGRKKMYGWLLVIVIWATLGLASSAQGAEASMSISAWLIAWRFLMGIGIGGDYPLSATITSEFAPTEHRSTMLAWVFLMQPVGQFIGTVTAMIATAAFKSQTQIYWRNDLTPECIRAIDRAWRIIVGFGTIPALIAWLVRLGIPESPRFTMDILLDTNKAVRDIEDYYAVSEQSHSGAQAAGGGDEKDALPDFSRWDEERTDDGLASTFRSTVKPSPDLSSDEPRSASGDAALHVQQPPETRNGPGLSLSQSGNTPLGTQPLSSPTLGHAHGLDFYPHRRSRVTSVGIAKQPHPEEYTYTKIKKWASAFWRWLGTERNSIHLAGTTFTWALLDFSFYGLGMSSASTIQEIWDGKCAGDPWPGALSRRAGGVEKPTVYDLLFGNSWHSSVVVSVGALSGGLALIYLIQYMRPKHIQTLFFAVLGLVLIIVGALFKPLIGTTCPPRHSASHWGIVVFYILCQVFFNLGANATTFIIPAVVFPTRYRCTCHGISAAGGKLGSVIAQLAIGLSRTTDQDPTALGWWLIGLGFLMFLGSGVTWWAVPDTRDAEGKNISLQDMEDELAFRGL